MVRIFLRDFYVLSTFLVSIKSAVSEIWRQYVIILRAAPAIWNNKLHQGAHNKTLSVTHTHTYTINQEKLSRIDQKSLPTIKVHKLKQVINYTCNFNLNLIYLRIQKKRIKVILLWSA